MKAVGMFRQWDVQAGGLLVSRHAFRPAARYHHERLQALTGKHISAHDAQSVTSRAEVGVQEGRVARLKPRL